MFNIPQSKFLLALVFIASQTTLVAGIEQQLITCGQIQANIERLKCYDDISKNLSTTNTDKSTVVNKQTSMTQVKENPAVVSVMDNSETTATIKPEVKIVYIEKPTKSVEVNANLVGDFKGWNPSSVFVLDNGQIWRAVRSNAKTKRLPKVLINPKISIKPSAFGSFNFRVEGVKGRLKVKRIK